MAKTPSIDVTRDYPVWIIPDNPVWTITPEMEDAGEVRFEMETSGSGWNRLRSVRGLAILTHPGIVYTHVYFYGIDASRYCPTIKILGTRTQSECCDALGIPDDGTIVSHVSTWQPEESASATIYGIRQLLDIREDGYSLSGRVSVNGRKYRAFTSSALMQRPDGKLVNVAVLHLTDRANADRRVADVA